MLRWHPGSRFYVRSEEGYRVATTCIGGNIIYTAWCPLHRRIAQRPSQEAAQQFCDEHYIAKLSKKAEAKRNAV